MSIEDIKIALQVASALGVGGLIRWIWNLGKRIESAERNIAVQNAAIEGLLHILQQNGKVTKDNIALIAKTLKLQAEAEGNPITREEADKLNNYIQWSREGRQFTPEQARDFHQLAEKYRRDPKVLEKTPAEDLGGLLVLAGLIFALYALTGSGKSGK